jgi:hypothetical protein
MKKTSPSLDWCIVRCDEDNKWWVDSISDEENWDIENLGIIDPKQFIHMNELFLLLKFLKKFPARKLNW